jgi:hypothetical protein
MATATEDRGLNWIAYNVSGPEDPTMRLRASHDTDL